MNPILKITDLHKAYRENRVLDGVSLELRANETTVLLGSNGAGKSTLLRCLLGLERPDAGDVCVLGRDPQRRGQAVRERVGYVPDHPDVYDWMTADELFRFLQPAYPTWSRERAERFAKWHQLGGVLIPMGRPVLPSASACSTDRGELLGEGVSAHRHV